MPEPSSSKKYSVSSPETKKPVDVTIPPPALLWSVCGLYNPLPKTISYAAAVPSVVAETFFLNLIVVIVALVIGSKAVRELEMDNKYKQILLKGSTYGIIIVYIFGLVGYASKVKGRGGKSIIYSILKTL